MRRLAGRVILNQDEYNDLVSELKYAYRQISDLLIKAEPIKERELELLRFKIREEGLEEKLRKAPNLNPRNWDQIYKPWLESFREYFYADTKIN